VLGAPSPGQLAIHTLSHSIAAIEARLDTAEAPGLTMVAERSEVVFPSAIGSPRAAAFARCELGGDHAPRDRLAPPQFPRLLPGPLVQPVRPCPSVQLRYGAQSFSVRSHPARPS
jgi:hypothetical protein